VHHKNEQNKVTTFVDGNILYKLVLRLRKFGRAKRRTTHQSC